MMNWPFSADTWAAIANTALVIGGVSVILGMAFLGFIIWLDERKRPR
jgi:hypothetical protein